MIELELPPGIKGADDFCQSSTVEDYLRVISTYESEGVTPRASLLRGHFGVSPATVAGALRRMDREGLLYLDAERRVKLTPVGAVAAQAVTRRHRLVECFLVDKLLVPWNRVFVLADEMEHYISARVERQLQLILDRPQVCPHGNPVAPCASTRSGLHRLSLMPPGSVSIVRVLEREAGNVNLMRWLEEHALLPGAHIEILETSSEMVTVRTALHRELRVPRLVAAAAMVGLESAQPWEPL